MKEIKAYKLSNGQIVENREEAVKLERKIIFEKAVRKFANKYGSYGEYADAIGEALIDNAEELVEVLWIAYPVKDYYTKKEVREFMYLAYNKRMEDEFVATTKEVNEWIDQKLGKDN